MVPVMQCHQGDAGHGQKEGQRVQYKGLRAGAWVGSGKTSAGLGEVWELPHPFWGVP